MTLWHLIARVAPADRAAVVDALAALVPMPASVTRDAVMRLDQEALDQWWDALGLRRHRLVEEVENDGTVVGELA